MCVCGVWCMVCVYVLGGHCVYGAHMRGCMFVPVNLSSRAGWCTVGPVMSCAPYACLARPPGHIALGPLPRSQAVATSYLAYKAKAERLVRNANGEGLLTAVLRPTSMRAA
jgi:hypothetical protein